ncbi:MAG: zinc ribbon domain-containing protein [Cyanobacteria bacterium J06621_8]
MPLYKYRCDPCGEFEAWHSLAEYNAPTECLHCDRPAPKIISVPNVNLNSGSISAIARKAEPRLFTKESQETSKPRYQSSTSGRPWMFSH